MLRCLFANLKWRNFTITPFFLQPNKKLRSKWYFRNLKSAIFNLLKCHLDLSFLLDCKKNGVIPKFLRFKLPNRHLKNSHVYSKCQVRLLKEEIKSKQKKINTLEKDTQRVKEELQRTLSVLDFSYICSLFLVANDKSVFIPWQYAKAKIAKFWE